MSPTNDEKAKETQADDLFDGLDEEYEATEAAELKELEDGDYTMALSARLSSNKDGVPMFIWGAVVTGPTRAGVRGSIFRVLEPERIGHFKKEMGKLGFGHLKPSQWRENSSLMQNIHAKVTGKRGKNPQYGPNWYINGLADGDAPAAAPAGEIAPAGSTPF